MENDRIYEIIRAQLTGSISREQQAMLDQWLLEDPRNQQVLHILRMHWNAEEQKTYVINQEEIKNKIWDELSFDQPQDESQGDLKWILKMAAVMVGILFCSYLVVKFQESQVSAEPSNELVTRTNTPGKKSTLTLSDGTSVTVNAESEIKFHERFSDTARIVWLSGEAYFEVAHQPERPFYVFTDNIEVQVLGTSFNVQNFPEVSDIRVSLSTGKLSVKSKQDQYGTPKLLDPGQQVFFKKTTGEFSKVEQFNSNEVQGWKDGIIYFRKSNFEEIVICLERWYGVDIQANNAPITNVSYTGHFERENLDNVLTSIGFVLNFTHSINDKDITVDFK